METLKIVGIGILLLVVLLVYPVLYVSSQETVRINVVDKERVVESNGESVSSRYLIFTGGETFANEDSWLFAKFDSSDFQGKLREGQQYTVIVAGWRVPFFSMYRNIVDVK